MDGEACQNLFWPLVGYFFVTLVAGIGAGLWLVRRVVLLPFLHYLALHRGIIRIHRFNSSQGLRKWTQTHKDEGETSRVVELSPGTMHPEAESWQINFRELRLSRLIGKGNVGEVYDGMYRGNRVAVKRLAGQWTTNEDMTERFRDEILLMSTVHHPNVVLFIGAARDPSGRMCLVTELCGRGSLYSYLHDPSVKISWQERIRMSTEIASGMHYLHGRANIIQRDLKTANLLLDDFLRVKIADFGLSRRLATGRMDTYCGTPATMAPEIVLQKHYDEKADVFSFGIILWEILTREDPYPGRFGLALAHAVANEGLRPPVPAYCPYEYGWVMTRAWSHRADDRPAFDDILDVLRQMQRKIDDMIRARQTGETRTAEEHPHRRNLDARVAKLMPAEMTLEPDG